MLFSLKWAKHVPKKLKANLSANVKIFSFFTYCRGFLPIPILNWEEKYFLEPY
jgi:hypothetical protein